MPVILAVGFVVMAPVVSAILFIIWIAIMMTSKTTIHNKTTGQDEDFRDIRGSLERAHLQLKEVTAASIHQGKVAKEYVAFNEALADIKYQAAGTSREAEINKIKAEQAKKAEERNTSLSTKKEEYARLLEEARKAYL